MQARFEEACDLAGTLMAQGYVVYSPIAHTHPIAVRCTLPRDFGYWEKADREFLSKCTDIYVAKMEGWDKSKGVQAEIKIALELGIPVTYINTNNKLLVMVRP